MNSEITPIENGNRKLATTVLHNDQLCILILEVLKNQTAYTRGVSGF